MDEKQKLFYDVSDRIWEFAETHFNLDKSATLLCDVLKKEVFIISRDLADMKDAFIAEYGYGKPVIGILAEYDALGNMSQKSDLFHKEAVNEGGNGHGKAFLARNGQFDDADAGGLSANVVQPTASLYYFIRAPKISQVAELYERVLKVAAMMTETEVEVEWILLAPVIFSEEDIEYTAKFYNELPKETKNSLQRKMQVMQVG